MREPGDRTAVAGVYALAPAAASASVALLSPLSGADVAHPLPWAWVVLAVAFAAAESFPFQVRLRRESLSLSVSSIPLLVGLYVLPVPLLAAVRVVPSVLALVAVRRQPAVKVVANGASLLAEVAAAVVVFHALAPTTVGVASWPGAVAAMVVADLVVWLVLTTFISVFEHRWLRGMLWTRLFTATNALVDTSVGLITVTLLAEEPAAVLLLAVVLAMVTVSYRVHTSLHEQHHDLAELTRITAEMADGVLDGRVGARVLTGARQLLRADAAWLYVPLDDGRLGMAVLDGDTTTTCPVAADGPHGALHAAAQVAGTAVLAGRRGGRADLAAALGVPAVLAAPLQGGSSTLVVTEGALRRLTGSEQRLLSALANHVSVAMANDGLVVRLREQAAAAEHQSLHDPVTHLPNRTLFGRELERHLEAGRPAAVLLLDLDRFKEVNDTLGHESGDLLLHQVAERLRSAVGTDGTVARLGGDEFAVLLPGIGDDEEARSAALAIQAALEPAIEIADVALDVRASIGVVLAPTHGDEVGALLQRADVAMYTAKADQSGIELYEHERDSYSRERLSLVGELRAAIAARELDVYFQPLMDLQRGLPIGAEALVRWRHPTRGNVPPDRIVRVAEHTGLIRPLTDLVLDRSLAECRVWRARGWDLRISVNMSARSLLQPTLVEDIAGALRRNGLPASSLCLELTETSMMADRRRTVAALEGLADLGVTVAVDDFGTGHSSLAYLKTLPVGELKIDKSFVKNMATDASDQAIVQSIVDLAANLHMPVVAEGIEELELADVLRAMGCDFGQGYGFARPMPAAALVEWLAERLDQHRAVPLRVVTG